MKLSLREKSSYGIAAVGKDIVYALSSGYVLYYYNVVMGISATFIGVILLVARVFDAVNDPFMGVIVAKTNSKFGRFRPWLFTGTILNAFVLFALFAVPSSVQGRSLLVYFAVVYILWGMTYTIMDIPYWSMIPAITDTPKERENLTVIARSCAGVGAAIVQVGTMVLVARLGGGSSSENYRTGFKWLTLIICAFFILATVIAVLNVKERRSENMNTVTVKQMFKSLINNDQAIVVVLTIVLVNTALYTIANLIIYFFQFDVRGDNWESTLALFNTFGGAMQILSMMVFYPLIRKLLPTMNVFKLSLCMTIGGCFLLLVLTLSGLTAVYFLFVPAFFIFSGYGMQSVLTTVFLADTVDYGELKNGHREESVIFSMQTFVVKLSSGIAALVASVGLDLIKLDPDAAVQSVSTVNGLRFMMSVLPIIGVIIAFILFRRYNLTETKLKEISDKLAAKKQ
ncbi:MAG: glycoside-pentoside-hexuronide (GPH):cation symporter [Spirochaetales bacterium]|nr:glycoside-pentoside-hexuronide (GPH):cation symporter [Spirochaetales bacterium]